MGHPAPSGASQIKPGVVAGNLGEPIRLSNVAVDGVAAEAAQKGQQAKLWVRMGITSDHRNFHPIAEGLSGVITHAANAAGVHVSLDRAGTVLLVIKPDKTADLWLDTAAVSLDVMMKRDMEAGQVVFEHDIADVGGMKFPLVPIGPKDKVICIFRQDWRFGLYFDFNPEGALDQEAMSRSLGQMYRSLKYRHLYDLIADEAVFRRLVDSGWFPFVEILGGDFRALANACAAGFDLADEEAKLVAKFPRQRLDHLLARWLRKPHLQPREALLKSAIDGFERGDPVAVIKIIATEIEGILADAYRTAHGGSAKIKTLLEFAREAAERRAGSPDTLLFPTAFAAYLTNYTFANFDPSGPKGSAGSRHAVGHGAADPATYTMPRALQVLLTLDQLAFST